MNALVGYSRYRFGIEHSRLRESPGGAPVGGSRFEQGSGLDEGTARVDLSVQAGARHRLAAGGTAVTRGFRPVDIERVRGAGADEDVYEATATSGTVGAAVYVSDEIALSRALRATVGLRADALRSAGRQWGALQPRARIDGSIGGGWYLAASGDRTWQPVHQLTNAGIGLPTDLWIPATETLSPGTGLQASAEAGRRWAGWEASASVFARRMSGVVEYLDASASLPSGTDWEADVTSGEGRAAGVELFVRKSGGRTEGWAGYTLSRSTRAFAEIEAGRAFPYRYDRTHSATLVLTHALSARRRVGLTAVASTGQAATFPISYSFPDPYRFSDRAAGRFPTYHRVDASYEVEYGPGTLTLSVYNVYNRRNPFALTLDTVSRAAPGPGGGPPTQQTVLRAITLFPLLPSVSYARRF